MASRKQDSDSDSDSEDNSNTSQRKEYSKIVSTRKGDVNAHDVAVGDPTAGPSQQHQPYLNSNSVPRAGPSWKGQSGATEDTDYTVFTERIKRDYKELLLPGIAWLTKGESSIEMNFVELTLNISGKPIRRADIFNAINKKIPKIILIEGQPGIGKTSLASKLAFDWAEGKGYIARHFKILLYLQLKELQQQQSFEDAILEFGKSYGFEEKIEDIIKANQYNTLFLLDGLDEVSEMNRYTILQLLYKKLYKYEHVHVLVTCRSGQFELTETERKQLLLPKNRTKKFCDVEITVEGIKSVEMKKMFLANFIENTHIREDEIISKLEKLSPNLDFFDSPLFLMLMVFTVGNEENDSPIFTQRTELYKRLFNCIIKHSCKRNEISLSPYFDLFDVSSDSEDTVKKNVIGKFGYLSLQKIIANDTIFVEDSFPIDIYNFGFLMKHKRILHCREDINYQAFHLSILEFAVAYSVWINYKSKNNFDENIITSIIKYFCYSNGTSLILPFLVGLLADDVDNLFQLTIFQQNLFQNIGIVLSMLEECQRKTVKRILPHLKNFLPSTIHLKTVKSFDIKTVDLCREIIRFGANCGQIKTIQTDDKIPSNIMKKFIIPNVTIVTVFNENELQQGFDAVYANDLSTHESLSQILSFFPSSNVTCQLMIFPLDTLYFQVQKNSVAITMSSTSGQSSFKTNRVLFSYLEFEIQTNPQKKYLMKLLQNNQVQYLNIKVFPAFKTNITDIYRAVCQSEYLTSLKLTGATRIDLKDLTNNGSKDFALLEVDCRLICCHPLQRQIRCRSLSCFNISVSSLIQIEPINLTCTIETIDDVMKECPYWTGFKSVNHLTVSINTDIVNLNALLAFKNLNLLRIILKVSVDSKMVAQCIKYLPRTELVIDDKFLDGNICQSLFEFWEKTDSNVQLITLKCYNKYFSLFSTDEFFLLFNSLIDALKSKDKVFNNIMNKILYNECSRLLQFKDYDESMVLEIFRSAHNNVTHTPTMSGNDLMIETIKTMLSEDENSDIIIPNSVTDLEDCMSEVYLPLCAEFRALIKGLDKNYWQSVRLECVSEFQMNELAVDLSKFNVFSCLLWSNFNNCVHKTNFDKHNLYPIYNYIIKRKLE